MQRRFATFEDDLGNVAPAHVMLLRRKPGDEAEPSYVMVLVFGNMTFQIVVPAPQEDKGLIGRAISLPPVSVFQFLEKDRVRGPTREQLALEAQRVGGPGPVDRLKF